MTENRDKLHQPYIAPTDASAINTGYAALRQGDIHDDDAAAIDQAFEAMPTPPIDYGKLLHPVEKEITPCTRIITRYHTLTSPDGGTTPAPPVQVLPRDPNRIRLFILAVTTVNWQFGSDLSDVYGAPVMSGNNSTTGYDLSGHTGALWVWTASPTIAAVFKVWAVTK